MPSKGCVCVLMWGTLPDSGAGADAGTRELKMLVGCHLWGRTESDMTEAT